MNDKTPIAALPDDYRSSAYFYHALDREDDVGAIIRAVGYVQDLLTQLYLRNVERFDQIDLHSLSYGGLIRLALTFGEITDELANVLRLLGKIRSPLSHDFTYELDAQSVRWFYDALPAAPYKPTNERLLANPEVFRGMPEAARLLRVGLMQVVLELVTCHKYPLERKRLPTKRVLLE